MKLTGHHKSELNACARATKPIWSGVLPENADSDLRLYLYHRLVEWVGNGYVITPAGRQALKGGSE